jgi:HIRAN domain
MGSSDHARIDGPTWMPAEEWAERVAAYRKHGRSDAEIRETAVHLERRGPRTREARIERAQRHGLVAREQYMTPEVESAALAPGPYGFPNAWMERVQDRLLVVTPSGWVNPRSRFQYKAGLHSFIVRGVGHHRAAAKAGDFTPGAVVTLVREPDNPYDRDAVAVYAREAQHLAGYVPRGFAPRLARRIDSGADLVAVSTRGAGPGVESVSPQVLVCVRPLWEHLNRPR